MKRIISWMLALLLVLSACPVMQAEAAGQTARITLDGYYDYTSGEHLLEKINSLRDEHGLEPLKMEMALLYAAQQRAVEHYIAPGDTRADGSAPETVLTPEWAAGFLAEQTSLGSGDVETVLNRMDESVLLSVGAVSVGIAFFTQNKGETAVVLTLNTMPCRTESEWRGKFQGTDLAVDVLPTRVMPMLSYPILNPSTCDGNVKFYKGMSVGVKLTLVRDGNTKNPIEIKTCDYTLTTTNPDVMAVDNEDHTLHFLKEGFATIGLKMAGKKMNFYAIQQNVEVLPKAELHYSIEDDYIVVDCSEFFTHAMSDLRLYCYSNRENQKEEMGWRWLGFSDTHREYIHHQDDTFTFVMSIYDDALGMSIEVGDRLVVMLGDEESRAPSMNQSSEETGAQLWLPDPSDIPVVTEEPEPEQVFHRLQDVLEVYAEAEIYGAGSTYTWAAGGVELPGGAVFGTESGAACAFMGISDLIFGSLPADVIFDVSVDTMRYGDLICFVDGSWGIVTAVAPGYIAVCRAWYQDSAQKTYLISSGSILMMPQELKQKASYALSRYESTHPGAAAFAPDIVPEDAVILEQGQEVSEGRALNYWAFAEDGTMYLYGYGYSYYMTLVMRGYKSQIRRLVIGQDVTEISREEFSSCKALEAVVLGDHVRSIGEEAFAGCSALERVDFGAGLRSIGYRAFQYCTALTEVMLPEGLEKIDSSAFYSCKALSAVSLPQTLTALGEHAFAHTRSLESVTIPGSVQTIPSSAFYGSGLVSLVISEGVERLEHNCFYGCTNLTSVELPASLQFIDLRAFSDCDAITDVYYNGSRQDWEQVENESGEIGCRGQNMHFAGECDHQNTVVVEGYAPGCETTGLTDGAVCADCGAVVTEQEPIDPLGHILGPWYEFEAPTVSKPTVFRSDCENCDYFETMTTEPWHTFELVTAEPTCTEPGWGKEVCLTCGFVSQILWEEDAYGHDYENGACLRCGEAEEIPANPFGDVKETDYYFLPVLWAVDQGITAGTGAGRFSPDDTCTRAQVVTFLWRAMGKPAAESRNNPFTDVSSGDYFYDAVLWAVEKGITAGTGAGVFSPDAPCTRGQVVTFLWRAMGKAAPASEENPFADVNASDYFYTPVLWAVEHQITAGTGAGKFSPEDSCTRGQVVTFLYRAMSDISP